jgi:restriction system protein
MLVIVSKDNKTQLEYIAAAVLSLTILYAVIKYIKHCSHSKSYLKSDINAINKMTGEEFEQFLMYHFKNLGYSVKTTPKTGDYGADLILQTENTKTVVQAKRYKGTVGVAAVQQIVAAKIYYGAQEGIVATNSYFTANAKELAECNNVKLIDRNELASIMSKADKSICPLCGGRLVLRKGTGGSFYGCSNYPNCYYTKDA